MKYKPMKITLTALIVPELKVIFDKDKAIIQTIT